MSSMKHSGKDIDTGLILGNGENGSYYQYVDIGRSQRELTIISNVYDNPELLEVV